jgi:hypothetical protein
MQLSKIFVIVIRRIMYWTEFQLASIVPSQIGMFPHAVPVDPMTDSAFFAILNLEDEIICVPLMESSPNDGCSPPPAQTLPTMAQLEREILDVRPSIAALIQECGAPA